MRDRSSLGRRIVASLACGFAALVATPVFASQITITTPSPLPDATDGVSYSVQLEAIPNNNKYPLRWSERIPGCFAEAGLFLTARGNLRGTAGPPGIYRCVVLVEQNNGDGDDNGNKGYVLEVKGGVIPPPDVPPAITSTCPESAAVGISYSKPITVTGTEPIAVVVTGLPAGLTFDPLQRLIAGTPLQSGAFPLVIGATNNAPPAATQTCTLTVSRAKAQFALDVKPNPAIEGQDVIATGTLSGGPPAPGGTVQFWVAASTERCPAPYELGTLPVTTNTQTIPVAGGQAKATFAALIVDNYHVCAQYSGDGVYDVAGAGPVDLFVIKGALLGASKVAIDAPTRVGPGEPLSARVSVTAVGGAALRAPEGRVQLRAGGQDIGTASLAGGSTVIALTAPMLPGSLALTATYFGDEAFAPAVSDVVNVAVLKADPDPNSIPTLSDAALVLTALIIALAALRVGRRRAR